MVPWAIAGRALSGVTRPGAERAKNAPAAAPESAETKDRREVIALKHTPWTVAAPPAVSIRAAYAEELSGNLLAVEN
jgi:hypothetical protein